MEPELLAGPSTPRASQGLEVSISGRATEQHALNTTPIDVDAMATQVTQVTPQRSNFRVSRPSTNFGGSRQFYGQGHGPHYNNHPQSMPRSFSALLHRAPFPSHTPRSVFPSGYFPRPPRGPLIEVPRHQLRQQEDSASSLGKGDFGNL